jgi:RNA polymerase sigma-70 factor (ECF subfamily)
MKESVAEVVRKASEGDRTAEATLCEAYRDRLRAFFWTEGTTPADADDLVQETLAATIQALRSRKEPPANFEGWLFRTARNIRVNLIRRRCRERSAADAPATPGAALPSDDLERQDLRRALWEAIGKLPRKYRVPLELHICDGLPYKEIAVTLDTNVRTVGVWIHRARRMLKDRLGPR